ncbi:hypothetical protein B0H10DRAFT_1938019 [Mycena sp. CBHHK59/15]|nr:hypothetical protein B0H10DRAFT_1938019 [Mycena sp. CBHHK59/15]
MASPLIKETYPKLWVYTQLLKESAGYKRSAAKLVQVEGEHNPYLWKWAWKQCLALQPDVLSLESIGSAEHPLRVLLVTTMSGAEIPKWVWFSYQKTWRLLPELEPRRIFACWIHSGYKVAAREYTTEQTLAIRHPRPSRGDSLYPCQRRKD